MSNSDKTSHWKSLAALLGTEAAAEPESTQPEAPSAPAASPPVSAAKPSLPPPPARPRANPPRPPAPRRESNWGKLASVLGLASAPAPEPVAGKPEPVDEPETAESEPAILESIWVSPPVSHTSDVADLAAAHWDAPDRDADFAIDPLEMTSEPFVDEALDAIDLDSIGDRDPAAEERPRRRRRRRGRGRGRRPAGDGTPPIQSADSAFEEPPVAADATTDITEDDDDNVMDSDLGDSDLGDSDLAESDREESDRADGLAPSRPGETGEGQEPRRRRRRRGRRGRREEGTGDAERAPRKREEPVARAPTSIRADLDDTDDDDSLEAIEREDDLGGDDEDSQLSHKKIPSWQEAVEAVIATNMTSRVNNPSSGGQRGGRGRGRRDR